MVDLKFLECKFTGDETKELVAKDLPTPGVQDKDAPKF